MEEGNYWDEAIEMSDQYEKDTVERILQGRFCEHLGRIPYLSLVNLSLFNTIATFDYKGIKMFIQTRDGGNNYKVKKEGGRWVRIRWVENDIDYSGITALARACERALTVGSMNILEYWFKKLLWEI